MATTFLTQARSWRPLTNFTIRVELALGLAQGLAEQKRPEAGAIDVQVGGQGGSAPGSAVEGVREKYRLVDPQSRVTVGEWTIVGGQSTLILRDGNGVPQVILEADPQRGGLIRIQDRRGTWHSFPFQTPQGE
jgi:hypothetical protein